MAKPFADDGAAGASGIPDADAAPGGPSNTSTPSVNGGNSATQMSSFGASPINGDPMGESAPSGSITGPQSTASASPGPAISYSSSSAPAGFGTFFEQGGGVPDDDGSGGGDPMSSALNTVDQVLQFGYSKYGLGGQQPQGGGVQEADAGYTNGRMPAVPGSQSNSGVPPLQPQPGPLPPTSNPFGKRADDSSGGVQDDDDGSA